jgi:hypothetical protein
MLNVSDAPCLSASVSGKERMRRIVKRLAALVGVIVAADLLFPGISSGEIALQAALVALAGGVMFFRQ